jgi:hypothetical protein
LTRKPSHFRYATNANIDDVFFVKYNLGHLRGRYANDGPDMIFDAEHFGGQEWSRIEPLVVETRTAQAQSSSQLPRWTLALSAHSAFVKSKDAAIGTIPIRIGTDARCVAFDGQRTTAGSHVLERIRGAIPAR